MIGPFCLPVPLVASLVVLFAAGASFQSEPPSVATINALVRKLKDPDKQVRWSAAKTLEEAGPAAKKAVPALIEALRDESVHDAAINALASIGPAALPDLLRSSEGDDLLPTSGAIRAIGEMGPGAKSAVPSLVKALSNRDRRIRVAAVSALGGVRDPATVPLLTRILKNDKDLKVRIFAADALAQFGPAAAEAVPTLIGAFKEALALDDDTGALTRSELIFNLVIHTRGLTTTSYGALVAVGPPAVPAVQELIASGSKEQRDVALQILGDMGPRARDAVPNLIAGLSRSKGDAEFRERTVQILGKIREPKTQVVPALARALQDVSGQVRVHAAVALITIDSDDQRAIASFSTLLKDNDVATRRLAFQELWNFSRPLGDLPPRFQAFVPALISGLNDLDADDRSYAAGILRELGERAKPAVSALVRALDDPNEVVRWSAAEALAAVQDGDMAVPGLINALNDKAIRVRAEAAHSLGAHGRKARAAIPALEKAAKEEGRVGRSAAEALRAVKGM
jgi:HEAT repeat protein